MQLTKLQKISIAGVAVLAVATVGLGTAVALDQRAGSARPTARPATAANRSVDPTTSVPGSPTEPTATDTAVADSASTPTSTPAAPPAAPPANPPAPDPGAPPAPNPGPDANPLLNPDIITKIDVMGPKLQITGGLCTQQQTKIFFTASDPSGVAGFTTTLSSENNGSPNPVQVGTVVGTSPDHYYALFTKVASTSNQITIMAKDSLGNKATTGIANMCA